MNPSDIERAFCAQADLCVADFSDYEPVDAADLDREYAARAGGLSQLSLTAMRLALWGAVDHVRQLGLDLSATYRRFPAVDAQA